MSNCRMYQFIPSHNDLDNWPQQSQVWKYLKKKVGTGEEVEDSNMEILEFRTLGVCF